MRNISARRSCIDSRANYSLGPRATVEGKSKFKPQELRTLYVVTVGGGAACVAAPPLGHPHRSAPTLDPKECAYIAWFELAPCVGVWRLASKIRLPQSGSPLTNTTSVVLIA